MLAAKPIRGQEISHLTSLTSKRSTPILIGKPSTSTPRVSDHPIPSPASTVASLTRELEDTLHTLDLQAAMRGNYVVKPQVSIFDKLQMYNVVNSVVAYFSNFMLLIRLLVV